MNHQVREQMIELLPRLQRFTYALTNSKADGEDLLQATYLRAIENLDKWIVGSRLDSWMYKMAQNIHINNMRHSAVKKRHLETTTTESVGVFDGVANAMHQDELKKVASSIEELPGDQRAVLLLVAVEGFGYAEAAEVLDVPIGTVTSRLARARQNLANSVYGQEG